MTNQSNQLNKPVCLTWSQTPKTGFLLMRLAYMMNTFGSFEIRAAVTYQSRVWTLSFLLRWFVLSTIIIIKGKPCNKTVEGFLWNLMLSLGSASCKQSEVLEDHKLSEPGKSKTVKHTTKIVSSIVECVIVAKLHFITKHFYWYPLWV